MTTIKKIDKNLISIQNTNDMTPAAQDEIPLLYY